MPKQNNLRQYNVVNKSNKCVLVCVCVCVHNNLEIKVKNNLFFVRNSVYEG